MPSQRGLVVVTGAFGYSGKYITRRMLEAGKQVRTLTNSPLREQPFGTAVEARPYNFDDPDALAESLRGAEALINTYWVRFDHGDFDHRQAVQNSRTLIDAARRAGVGRVVHVSILNANEADDLPYYKGKAEVEAALVASGLPHTILRPALLFGYEDILVNNIAWLLRHSPVFAVVGDGSFGLRPIFVDDLARLAVAALDDDGSVVRDAVGPETYAYRDFVETIAAAIGLRRVLVEAPSQVVLAAADVAGRVLGDVVLTPEEVDGLKRGLLSVDGPASGATAFSQWLIDQRGSLGRRYSSELARRRDRLHSYQSLRTRPKA